MSERGTPSIMCDKCGGWHPTEAHVQHEGDEREKRRTEIKARPDSAYRFDALGFKPQRESEEESEMESWMHEVIEKAKELGDDLHDSEWYVHVGPLDHYDTGKEKSPSVLTFLTKEYSDFLEQSKKRSIYINIHHSGEQIESWAAVQLRKILPAQERYVQTRSEDDLEKYKDALRQALEYHIDDERQFQRKTKNEEDIASSNERITIFQQYRDGLDTTEGRKQAMDFIAKYASYNRGSTVENPQSTVGIIFHMSDRIRSDSQFSVSDAKNQSVTYKPNGQFLFQTDHHPSGNGHRWEIYGESMNEHKMSFQARGVLPDDVERAANRFYRDLVHAVYVPTGSIDEQREVLKKMLEMTKDHPERRVPIYNYYGKLVWPRPPEEDKK